MMTINFRMVHLDPQYFNLLNILFITHKFMIHFFNFHYINKTDPKTVRQNTV